MGHYTQFRFKASLKEDTPEEIIDFLKKVIIEGDLSTDQVIFSSKLGQPPIPNINHDFFKCPRWYMLLISNNFGCVPGGSMFQKDNQWFLDLHTEFKNYDEEVDHFMDWITPYTETIEKASFEPEDYTEINLL